MGENFILCVKGGEMKKTTCLVMLFVIMFTQFGIIKSIALDNIINVPNELSNIDFSKPLNPNEEKRVTKYYERKFAKKFTDEWVRKQLVQGKKMHVKEFGCSANKMRINGKKGKRRHNALGTTGDVLIKYHKKIRRYYIMFPGHAAIVDKNPNWTIESFPGFTGMRDGVRKYPNTWKAKSRNAFGTYVKNASKRQCARAAEYARKQIGKPYNIVIFNKGTTRKFYCSQLVWRAWLEQGFNLDWFDYGRYEPVYPFELYLSKKTVQYYVN